MQPAARQVVEIQANLDDVSGELVGSVVEALLGEGALDVWTTPIMMKKQRPGVMLSLLCEAGESDRLGRRVMEMTGSFGVRSRGWERLVLDRRHERIETAYGPIRLKVGSLEGEVVAVKPEFEDVREAADRAGVSVRRVLEIARAAAEAWQGKAEGGRS